MKDVARLAGVSQQTVSRVLNDHPHVAGQTRLRVQAAMAELGYRPNGAARALATGRSRTIGVIAQNTTLFGPASLLSAFEYSAGEAGFAVSVSSVRVLDRTSISGALEMHLRHGVAGVVVIAPVAIAGEALDQLAGGLPLVSIDGDPAHSATLVTVDQELGARLATEHLLGLGHGTVWHIAGPPDWFDAIGRAAGWRAALQAAGAEEPPLLTGDWTPAAGYRAGQLLAQMPDVTAVFAANDHTALGLYKALRESGRRVPGDVSIVGFDDLPESSYLDPALTTVHPDFDEVARASLGQLLGQLDGSIPSGERHTVQPDLVIRASAVAPRSR